VNAISLVNEPRNYPYFHQDLFFGRDNQPNRLAFAQGTEGILHDMLDPSLKRVIIKVPRDDPERIKKEADVIAHLNAGEERIISELSSKDAFA
jgi:hypothetical protein